ncbi:MAG: hypothetical protein AB4040_16025 [Synechococcus sp.]
MTLLFHIGLTTALSALLAISVRQRHPPLLIAEVGLISVALWSILDGMWQPTHAFSVLEPSFLLVILAGIVSTYTIGQWPPTTIALITFLAVGGVTTLVAQPLLQPVQVGDFIPVVREAINSGAPMVLAALGGVALYATCISPQWQWPRAVALGVALAAALVSDSVIYTALSQGKQLWSTSAWIHPLLLKLADKILLSAVIVTPLVSWGLAGIEETARQANPKG